MSRAFAASLSDVSQSPDLAAVVIATAAALFAAALIVALFRAGRSFAIIAVVAIVVLAAGLAAAMLAQESSKPLASVSPPAGFAAVPALACLDELAGEIVASACERAVFSSAETTAAAVSYTAAQISRLASYGNVAAANQVMTPSLRALRRAVERDRFGMVAHVLTARDECTLSKCAFFASLTNTAQIANNMSGRVYDALVARHAATWGLSPSSSMVPSAALAPNEPERPSGKPVSGDFPSSASIPPISIMAPEPATAAVPAKSAEGAHAAPQPKAAAKKPAPSHPRALTPPAVAATPPAPAAQAPASAPGTGDSR
jgi:hypothetical protein